MKNVSSAGNFFVRIVFATVMAVIMTVFGFSNFAGAAEQDNFADRQQKGDENFRDPEHGGDDRDRREPGRDFENGSDEQEGRKGPMMNNGGNERAIKMIKKMIEKLPAGWSVPQELTEALSKTDDVDSMDIIREYEGRLRMVSDYVRMEKQSGRELKRMSKKIAQAEASLAKSGIDAANLLASARNAVGNSQALLDKALAEAKVFSEDTQFSIQDFFESVGEAWQIIGSLDAVRQISKGTQRIEKNIVSAKKKIQSFAKKNPGVDVTEALALVDEAAKVVAELKAYVSSTDFDPEEAVTYFEDLIDLHEQIDDALDGQLDVNFFPMGMSKGMQGEMRQGGMGQEGGGMDQRGGMRQGGGEGPGGPGF